MSWSVASVAERWSENPRATAREDAGPDRSVAAKVSLKLVALGVVLASKLGAWLEGWSATDCILEAFITRSRACVGGRRPAGFMRRGVVSRMALSCCMPGGVDADSFCGDCGTCCVDCADCSTPISFQLVGIVGMDARRERSDSFLCRFGRASSTTADFLVDTRPAFSSDFPFSRFGFPPLLRSPLAAPTEV